MRVTITSSSPIQTITVGIGFSPIPRKWFALALADYTAGRDFHPAPKTQLFNYALMITHNHEKVKGFIDVTDTDTKTDVAEKSFMRCILLPCAYILEA